MPRNERVLVAFVGSPSDLEAERSRLEEVVQELNTTWSRALGARIELLRWETSAYPGIGRDPQDVINQQVGDDYDIFIGLMWGRFGSPGERAGSGTEEEFRRAKARYDRDPGAVRIMFYFKDEPVSPSKLDPGQLARVQSFQASLGSEGVLYWTFRTVEEFADLIRLHLARQFQESLRLSPPREREESPVDQKVPQDEEEPGLLDLLEVFDERFSAINDTVVRLSAATEDLGDRMRERAEEIRLATQGKGISKADGKRLINRGANELQRYATRAEADLPVLRSSLREGMSVVGQAVALAVEVDPNEVPKLRETRSALGILGQRLAETRASISSFRGNIQSLPRMTTALNKGKRSALSVVDELLEILEQAQRDATEVEKAIDAILVKE